MFFKNIKLIFTVLGSYKTETLFFSIPRTMKSFPLTATEQSPFLTASIAYST